MYTFVCIATIVSPFFCSVRHGDSFNHCKRVVPFDTAYPSSCKRFQSFAYSVVKYVSVEEGNIIIIPSVSKSFSILNLVISKRLFTTYWITLQSTPRYRRDTHLPHYLISLLPRVHYLTHHHYEKRLYNTTTCCRCRCTIFINRSR